MSKNNWRKHSSLALSALLLFNSVAPIAAPLVGYAQAEGENEIELIQTIETGISVADAITKNNDGSTATVTGYIVGYTIGSGNVSQDDFREDWNFAIADSADETDFEKMVIVQIPSEFRDDFGLKTNPDMLGEKVNITGNLEKYHGGFGLKDPSEFTSDAVTEPEIPEEIMSIANARTQGTGMAKVKGTVTAKLKNSIQIQDTTGGIAVRPTSLDVELGDEITVAGSLQEFKKLLQLDSAEIIGEVTKGEAPKAELIAVSDLAKHQSELISMSDIKITSSEGFGNYIAEDKEGNSFTLRDENESLFIEEGYVYESVTGISSQYGDTLQVIPRDIGDLVPDENTIQVAYATPGSGSIAVGTEVTLTTGTKDAEIYYTLDGTTPTKDSKHYTESIVIGENTTLKTIAIRGNLESSVASFDYTVYDAEEGLQIRDIQGEGHVSPLDGSRVDNIEGVVTYKYDIRGSHYFHMQTPDDKTDEDSKASDAIVVYTGRDSEVKVGDLIEVSGDVSEFYIDGYGEKEDTDLPVTQINARDDKGGIIDTIATNVALPKALKITSSKIPGEIASPESEPLNQDNPVYDPETYSMDFWESIEGMRVEIAPSRATAPQQHGDLVVVTEEYDPVDENGESLETIHGGIRLTDKGIDSRLIQFKVQPNDNARDLKVKTGDKFTEALTGVVNYGFGNYKVYADLEDVNAVHEEAVYPEVEEIVKDESKLSVAAYNVENYSANNSKDETPDEKSKRIAESFVNDMKTPDIIGLIEVMDNDGSASGGPEADKSYKRLIADIEKAGGPIYDFVNIDPEYNKDGGKPSGNIRVGYLYNPERVGFNGYGTDNDTIKTDAVKYESGKLSTNPGRVSPDVFNGTRKPLAAQFEFNGESIVILNNHLNSKRGDVPEYGQVQPAVKGSEARRIELATEVNNFVKEIKKDNPEENVVVLGDMNDFQFSAPLQALKGDELTNMIEQIPENDRYSYVYSGMSQVLDHILVSNNLAENADINSVHVNADYTDMHTRASDHDPVLVQVDLSEKEEVVDGFKLPIMHMNDTHANVENYPYINTLVKQYREENPQSLLLHGGDVFSGTLYFNKFKGQADLALLNLMGMDAMVFGNHEFDLGDSDEGHKALTEFVDNANFPMLGTNIDFTEDELLKKYEPKESLVNKAEAGNVYNSIVVEREGEKIGIFGLTTEDSKNISSPMSVSFTNYTETAKEEIAKLEEAGIDKIVALTHLGHDSAPAVGNDLLLAEKVDGIDVVVGGHSHTEVGEPKLVEKEGKASTVVVQAGQYAENLGTVEVIFDENGEVVDYAGELLPIEENYEKVVEPDAESLEILKPFKEEVDELASSETGAVALKELENPRLGDGDEITVRGNETALGNLITDAMLAKSKEKESDIVISMQNGGGIRTSIDKGPITNGEVIKVLPFGNNPVVVELSGVEIKEIMEHAVRHEDGTENGGFLHVSGMKYYYDSTKAAGNRVVKMYLVNEDGKETEIKATDNYKITTNGFTGQGGDGFETFEKAAKEGRVRDLGEEDWQQLVDYMVDEKYLNGVVDPEIEGRIIDLKGENLPTDPDQPSEETGWVKKDGTWFYYIDGTAQTGWVNVDGTWFYMNHSAEMQTGWEKVNGTWYYMDNSGAMQTGWEKVNGTWYLLDSSGAMQTGWEKVNGTWYYMSNSGAMRTGWEKVNGTWYLLDSSGAMQTGWEKVNGKWYYMSNSGAMQTGWEKVNGKWYYMSNSGAMQTGWEKVHGTWYFLDNSGAMQTGWIRRAGSWYYTNNSGAMQTGWVKLDGKWYYLHTNGRMRTGWVKIDKKWYYFSGSGDMQ